MANFNELIKYYRNQVTNQDPEDFEMSATHAAEEIEGMASRYAEQVDADMTMSIVLQAVAHYLDVQDDKFEKRRKRKSAEGFMEAEMEAKEVEEGKHEKPDYIDADGDGDKKETMKKALKDKKEKVDESSDSIKCSECGQTIYLDTPQDKAAAAAGHDTCADCNTTEEAAEEEPRTISSLSESFKQEIADGLKKIL